MLVPQQLNLAALSLLWRRKGGKGRKTFLDFVGDPWMGTWELLMESEISTDSTFG